MTLIPDCGCGGKRTIRRWIRSVPSWGWASCLSCGEQVPIYAGHEGAIFVSKEEAVDSLINAHRGTTLGVMHPKK